MKTCKVCQSDFGTTRGETQICAICINKLTRWNGAINHFETKGMSAWRVVDYVDVTIEYERVTKELKSQLRDQDDRYYMLECMLEKLSEMIEVQNCDIALFNSILSQNN